MMLVNKMVVASLVTDHYVSVESKTYSNLNCMKSINILLFSFLIQFLSVFSQILDLSLLAAQESIEKK